MAEPKLQRGALRAALLAEVKRICETEGPDAVSITRIGKALGVSSGAPFRIFPTREDIFLALIEQDMTRLEERFLEVTQDAGVTNPKARLTALCHAYLSHARDEPAMFRLSFSLSAKALQGISLLALGERIYGHVTTAVAACTSDLSEHAVQARAHLVWSTIHGHAMLRLTGQLDDLNLTVADAEVVSAAVAGFLPE